MYSEIRDKNKPDQISIITEEDVYQKITSDLEIQQQCSMIRALSRTFERSGEFNHRDEKETAKAKLPAFIPAGEFSYRKSSSITKYWGRIVLDIDNHNNPESLRAKIKSEKEPSVILAFLSPSGNGLKVIHQLDYPDLDSTDDTIDFHKQAFQTLIAHYKKKYKVDEIDLSGSDLSRLCYYSHDNSAYYNQEATGWSFNYLLRQRTSQPILNTQIEGYYTRFTKDDERANLIVIEEIIHWCQRENIALLDHYNDWMRALFAIKNTISDSRVGLELFLQLSATSPKFKKEECLNKWENTTLDNRGRMVTLGTILFMAKKCGWRKPRNFYIGTGANLNGKVAAVEESNIRLKYNKLTHQIYYSDSPNNECWVLVDDQIEGRLKLDVLHLALKREEFDGFIKYIPPQYNPVDEFLKSLPKWDGTDRFPQLINTLTIKHPEKNSLQGILLRKWMIGVVNGLHNRPENAHKPNFSPNEKPAYPNRSTGDW